MLVKIIRLYIKPPNRGWFFILFYFIFCCIHPEKIPWESVRMGEFVINGLPSNALTAARVLMRCSVGQPIQSNMVYGWTKVAGSGIECSSGKSDLDQSAGLFTCTFESTSNIFHCLTTS